MALTQRSGSLNYIMLEKTPIEAMSLTIFLDLLHS